MKHGFLYYLEYEKQYNRLRLLAYGCHHDLLIPDEKDELDEWILISDENLDAFERMIDMLL